jgi:hypothetical protein
MTALVTGLALAPLVIQGGIPGQEITRPMAIVILGGLVTSTVLNLFIVPVLYLGFSPKYLRKMDLVPVGAGSVQGTGSAQGTIPTGPEQETGDDSVISV